MSMVLRHGATQKQRLGRPRSEIPGSAVHLQGAAAEEGTMPEFDQVDAMVEGVKARGVSIPATAFLPHTDV